MSETVTLTCPACSAVFQRVMYPSTINKSKTFYCSFECSKPACKPARPVVDRLMDMCVPEPNTGCWLWTGSVSGKGYGSIRVGSKIDGDRRKESAHRVAYEAFVGAIPEGLVIDHLCRTPSCINPRHLEPVTMGENTRRGRNAEVNRARRAAVAHCPEGHPVHLEREGG